MFRLRELRCIISDTRGLAFVEFAFVAPVLLILIFVGLEIANYALAHLRVSQIAVTVADNAGRVTTGIDEANIYEVFAGAESIGNSINFKENGQIVLSSLQHNGLRGRNEGQMINWQRCWGNLDQGSLYGEQDDGKANASLRDGIGPIGNRISSIEGTAVMFVEASFKYQPLLDLGIIELPPIRYESAFNVRGRLNNNITNATSLAVMSC